MTPQEKMASFVSVLQPGNQYTFVQYGEMGFLQDMQCTLMSVDPCRYAQYEHACRVVVKVKGKRTAREFLYYAREGHFLDQLPTVWAGWVEPFTKMYGPMEHSETGLECL